MPDKGSLIGRAYGEFAPDDQIGLAGLENVDGMSVKVGVAQVDLVADDEVATREEDALLQRLAVVRFP